MYNYYPCWKIDQLEEEDALFYFGKRPVFKGIGSTDCQSNLFKTIQVSSMALKPRLANSPTVDFEGWCIAEIVDVTFLEDGESEYSGEQFLFDFFATGIQRPINLKVWTGVKINPDRYQVNGSKTKEYNKLTRVCLALGLVSETELKAIKAKSDLDALAIGEKLEALKGQQVRFKLLKTAKGKGLSQIDLDSLQLLIAETSEKSKG